MGTPASISASVLPQMEAWEVEPLLDTTSETRRIAYGNSFSSGMTGRRARSASAPWPISRLPGLPRRFTSPAVELPELEGYLSRKLEKQD